MSCSQIFLSLACFIILAVHISLFVEGVDECKTGLKSCSEDGSECIDADLTKNGTATCRCKKGYTGNGTVCQDINECKNDTHVACPGEGKQCENNFGSYACFCKRGYKTVNETCIDKNDCVRLKICHKDAECIVTGGNFTCKCKSGYSGDGFKNCTDINECEGSHGCHANTSCENTPGSYECFCKVKVTRGKSCQAQQTNCKVVDDNNNNDNDDDNDDDDTVIALVAVTIVLLILCLIALIVAIIYVYRMKKSQ